MLTKSGEITKKNLKQFLIYYHCLHDTEISSIVYDTKESIITLMLDVCWTGKPKLKEDGYYETNPKKMKLIFEWIPECNIKEIPDWYTIDCINIEFITLKNNKLLRFDTGELYIVAKTIKYEELESIV